MPHNIDWGLLFKCIILMAVTSIAIILLFKTLSILLDGQPAKNASSNRHTVWRVKTFVVPTVGFNLEHTFRHLDSMMETLGPVRLHQVQDQMLTEDDGFGGTLKVRQVIVRTVTYEKDL